ncbi:MAG: FUSC family protein [Shinella sp.]|nr:FUSC family protein [Shinella sp.]
MTFPTWRDWLFSGKAFLASMLALYIALWLDLQRPYWAMAAVYVVANPLAGATSSKGLYRALGTLLGASAAVFFVPLLVNAPELLSLAVALWTGTLLYISMLDRTPRSYVFMLAGYSLPLIALPTVGAPETIFDTALARCQEIILGITCASVVSAVVFPTSLSTAFQVRISSWLADAGAWANDILRRGGASPVTPFNRQKLAADISGLDMMISQLGYDAGTREIVRHARELRGRLMMLLPLFSSLADRLHALKATEGGIPAEIQPLLDDIAGWMEGEENASLQQVEDGLAGLQKLEHSHRAQWDRLLISSALARLREIVDVWQDCLTLREQIAAGRQAGSWKPKFRHRRVVGRARYHDYGMILFATGSAVAATLLASLIWIETGWQNGAGFVMMTAVACSFFAALDRPAPMILSMFIWCAVSLVVSFVYVFAILPGIQSYEMLVVVFAVPFLILGTLIPRPQYMMLGMLLAVNTASFVALQNRYGADFTTFANEAIAALAGIGFALVWTQVARPFGAEIAARRLVRAGWSDLAETAAGERRQDHESLAGRMLDRLGQLVPRLAALEDRELAKVDGFAEVRLGFNILVLQRERRRLRGASAAAIGSLLSEIADFFKERVKRGAALQPPEAIRASVDRTLRILLLEHAERGREAIDALVGVRRGLFPDAPGPSEADSAALSSLLLPLAAE